MNALRKYLDKIKPNFEEGGKYHAFRSVFEGFETFLFVPNTTSKSGTHIHDSIDSKRIMSIVVIALIPALLFGMYNVGYQHFHATGMTGGFWEMFGYGFLAVLPKIIVSYVVGLGIEFIVAQWKKEEIQEGFLVSGILIPMIVPVDCPLWMLAIATAFSVIFAKEVFGGTGMNVFNVAFIINILLKSCGDTLIVGNINLFIIIFRQHFRTGTNRRRTDRGHPLRHCQDFGRCSRFLLGHGDGTHTRFYRRNKRHSHSHWCHYLALDRHCQLENHAVRFRGRCFHGLDIQCGRTRHSRRTHALVRTSCVGWLLLRCSIYGNRPCHFCTH